MHLGEEELKAIVAWLVAGGLGLIATLLVWFARREWGRRDTDLSLIQTRVTSIEGKLDTFVTCEDFNKVITELRAERRAQHDQGTALLEKIDAKMDRNEAKDSKTRHDINDTVHTVKLQNAVMKAQLEGLDKSISSLKGNVDKSLETLSEQVQGLLNRERQK
jgi:hypothetical protein